MYWTKYFIPTLKEVPVGTEAISHQLLLRAGLVHMLTSGVYSYLPLGLKVLSRVKQIIREEMNRIGANELLLPAVHPIELWKETGRDKDLEEVMYKFTDNRKRPLCLGPTHEEVITNLVKDFIQSYKQLPVVLYQIQTKFRDEIRPRFGIVRACEFSMKDAYSFDKDEEGLKKNYQLMYEAYVKIFNRLDLKTVITEADSGAMGGSLSHEFLVPAPIGEDKVMVKDKKGGKKEHVAIELGHIFQLGTKYSEAQGAHFLDDDGKQKPILMGCYGIGVSRIISAIIETHHDEKGILWPDEVAPFDIEILSIFGKDDEGIQGATEKLYRELTNDGLDVLVDDRMESAGCKFNDADLIGIPYRVIIGQKNLTNGNVEIKNRKSGKINLIPIKEVRLKLKELYNND